MLNNSGYHVPNKVPHQAWCIFAIAYSQQPLHTSESQKEHIGKLRTLLASNHRSQRKEKERRMRTLVHTVLSIAIAASPALHAQTSNAAPAFDVAAIRQTLATRGRPRITSSPFDGSFTATNATLKLLLEYAYGLPQT